MNNFIKILSHLKQFEGDGEFHEIESQLEASHETKRIVFSQLSQEGLIRLKGGYRNVDTLVTFGDLKGNWHTPNYPDKVIYYPFEGQLTFKGSEYLKSEEKPSQSKVNVKTGENSNVNLIVNSRDGIIVDNSNKIISQSKKIIDKIKSDGSLTKTESQKAIQVFENLMSEAQQGKVKANTWEKVVNIGEKIATIGSMVISLLSIRK